MAADGSRQTLGFALLVFVAFGWGVNWPAIKTVVNEVPLWQFRWVTGYAAAAMLLGMAIVFRQRLRVPLRQWPVLLLASVLNITSWFMLMAWGADLMNAGHAAILAFTMPVFAAVFGVLFAGERMTWARAAAVLLTCGVVVVILSHDFEALEASQLGVLVTLIGAMNWAIGTLVQKHTAWAIPPMSLAGWQMLIGCTPILIISLITEEFTYHEASEAAIWASVYLAVVALGFCYVAWFTVVQIFPASVAAIGTLMVPTIGAMSSSLLLDEPFGWREIAALLMVVTAIALVLYFNPAPRPAQAPAE